MLDEHSVRAAIAAYIRDNFLYGRPHYSLGDNDRILDDGIVDSMGAVELVAFLESRFGISIPDDEITEDHFATVTAMASLVVSKRRTAA